MTSLQDAWGNSGNQSHMASRQVQMPPQQQDSPMSRSPQHHHMVPSMPPQHHMSQPMSMPPQTHMINSPYPTSNEVPPEPKVTTIQLIQGVMAESESFMNNKLQQVKTHLTNTVEDKNTSLTYIVVGLTVLIIVGLLLLTLWQSKMFKTLSQEITQAVKTAHTTSLAASVSPAMLGNMLSVNNIP